MIVYGLKNCDTCRKARKWLEAEGLEHEFRDVRQDPLSRADVVRWIESAGTDVMVNKRGTTWRGLSDAEKATDTDAAFADLMLQHPAIIKRPVFDDGGQVLVGFTDAVRDAVQAHART